MSANTSRVTVSSGAALDVREFEVEEAISRLFEVRLVAVSTDPDLDFAGVIGQPARFEVLRVSPVDDETRQWSGISADIEQVRVSEDGLATYALRIVPAMWLLTHRRNYRVFQDKSELDVALEVLAGWGIEPTLLLDKTTFAKRRMRVQYAESDFDFVSRLLEDIGVAYFFEPSGEGTALVLADGPNTATPRPPLPFVDKPNDRVSIEWVTAIRSGRHVRPGRVTASDVDYRKALDYPLAASATSGNAVEASLEQYHHDYGSFLWKTADGGGGTPFADDRGAARTDEGEGRKRVERRLGAHRVEAKSCSFCTSAHDLRPGKVLTITGHPNPDVGAPLLVVGSRFAGSATGSFRHTCEARFADVDFRPAVSTPKPRTRGLESATVTGPAGEAIHTDELGRVRVHFHWDRDGANDEQSSCWVPVDQPWAGAGFGAINLPRVGQEVLVDFLGADPDRPVVVGRVHTATTPPPYQLPKYKMVSGHRSESYPKPKGAAPAAPPSGPAQPGTFGSPQRSPSEFGQMVTQNLGGSSDGGDHQRSANALMHDDTAGGELVYLQAQRDLSRATKNNHATNVGANQTCDVAGNNTVTVGGFDDTSVVRDRKVEVGGDQSHQVVGDVLLLGCKDLAYATPCGEQSLSAKTAITMAALERQIALILGDDVAILLRNDGILVRAPIVFINPGDAFVATVLGGGKMPSEGEQDSENRIAAALRAILKYHTDHYTGPYRNDAPLAASLDSTVRAQGRGETPYTLAARQDVPGLTNDEVAQAASSARTIMFGPKP